MIRRPLSVKYATYLAALVVVVLLVGAMAQLHFFYDQNQNALAALQQKEAKLAGAYLDQFIRATVDQLLWANPPLPSALSDGAEQEQRLADYLRLLRQVRAVREVTFLDPL